MMQVGREMHPWYQICRDKNLQYWQEQQKQESIAALLAGWP